MNDVTNINGLRDRYLKGENLTLEEIRTLLASIRRGYKSATESKPVRAAKSTSTRSSGAKPSLSLSDIDKLF